MRRPLAVAAHSFAAVFLSMIGLLAYGCSDSATVNPVVELASLTVNPGTLHPAFSGDITQYTVNLSNNVTAVTVTAQPAVSGDRVTINGQATTSRTITLNPEGSPTIVSIVVSEVDTNSRTYTVVINRAGLTGNNSLQSLAVSPGTLAPAFNANTLAYTVDVANNVTSLSVTPTLDDPAATMTVNGQSATSGQARTIILDNPGQSTTITITVTAQNGNEKTYLISVSRGVSGNNNLRSLTVSPGTLAPAFSAGTVGYSVNVAHSVTSITVTAAPQDTAASMTVNEQGTNSGQPRTIPLRGSGSNTFITIVVTAQNGAQKTYTVDVGRAAPAGNNTLRGLTVSPGALDPSFNASTTRYTVNVGSNVSSVDVTATKSDPNAVMTDDVTAGAGTATGRATIQLNGPGTATSVSITVTAPNGSSNTYTITVNRAAQAGNNNISALTVSPGSLSPSFRADRTNYSVNVDSTVSSVTVTATKADPSAVLTINGQGTNSGQARTIALEPPGSSTDIAVTVTAPNGSSKTYMVTVNRPLPSGNNNLSALTVAPGSLTPRFAADTLNYTVNVPADVAGVTVSATKANPDAVISGDVPNGGQATIPLDGPGTSTNISITVTAPNGDSKTYTIIVNRAASGDEGDNRGNGGGNGGNRGNGNGGNDNGNDEDDD